MAHSFKYTFIDTESWWDEGLHEAYRHLDPDTEHHRIGCRRIGAAAAFDVTIDAVGRIEVGTLASWTSHDHGDEQAVVSELFDHLRQRDDRIVVTFGGIAVDLQLLTLAAMEHGLRLPQQLLDVPGRKSPRPHQDLALMLKGGGRTFHHLSEIAIRLGVPVKLLEGKARVHAPVAAAAWEQVRGHCERDCLITALAMLAWRCAQGQDALRLQPAMVSLIAGFLRQRPEHEAADQLWAYQAQLEQLIADGWAQAA